MKYFFSIVLFVLISIGAWCQYSLSTPSYTQDFNSLGTTGTNTAAGGDLSLFNISLNGWFFSEAGTGGNDQFNAGTGTNTAGNTYNFGTTASTERTLGGLQSGTVDPTIGFYAINNTGTTITSLTINYTGEQWRLGEISRVDKLDFQYSLNASSLTNGAWIDADALDFTSPVTLPASGALDGNMAVNRSAVTSTIIGISIPDGSTFFLRWTDFDATGSDDGLGIDDFSLSISTAIPIINHYRSVQSGGWNDMNTWQSSSDGISWVAASSVPSSSSNSITIRTGHSVTIAAFTSADQLIIQNGAVLDFNNGVFTINDGAGDDIDIENGGIFVLSYNGNPPTFGSGNPTINVRTGGMLRVSASGLTNIQGAGIHANNYLYQHQSILEYTLGGAFGTVNITYFPNANAVTVPVFRTTSNANLLVGSNSPTTFNGVFEHIGTGDITWQNSGNKIFRNGIRNVGTVTANASAALAKFIINGANAELGGTGSLILPVTGGLEIGPSATVTLISDKIITGNVSLLANSYVELGSNNLSVSGTISGGSATSFIRTNGTGSLTLANVIAKIFPIGNTTYNPITITNGNNANYSARVENGIVPGIAFPAYGINRTWNIRANIVTPNVTVGFQYRAADANANVLPQPQPMEILQHIGIGWSILTGNTNINPTGSDPYVVTSLTGLTINNSFMPYALGKAGGWVLPIDYFITATAKKTNHGAAIEIKTFNNENVNLFEVQRSVNGSSFKTIGNFVPIANQFNYFFTDPQLHNGISIYRIKAIRQTGGDSYSNQVALIENSKDIVINALYPNPVKDHAIISISASAKEYVRLQITDITGRIIKKWNASINDGVSAIDLNTEHFPTGHYHFTVYTSEGVRKSIPFIKR